MTLLALLGLLPHWGQASSVRPIEFLNREILSFEMSDAAWQRISDKVYRFVSHRIVDPKPGEKIQVVFDSSQRCVGFVPRAGENVRKIFISSTIRSHVDLQVVLAHELTHVLRHMYQRDEEYWLDEGLAKWMEWNYIGDFPTEYLDALKGKSEIALPEAPLDCLAGHQDYATSYFLMLYMHNHFGGESFISALGASSLKGWDNVESTVRELKGRGAIGVDSKYLYRDSIFRHFALALVLNDPFAADYALLGLDSRFKPVSMSKIRISASWRPGLEGEKGDCETYGFDHEKLSGFRTSASLVEVCLPLKAEAIK